MTEKLTEQELQRMRDYHEARRLLWEQYPEFVTRHPDEWPLVTDVGHGDDDPRSGREPE